ncbi:MAG TPA: hypothetical protein VM513_25845 [Kofleriaceae bacterium]|nr:hypothetical protein [Kofleriaceae bacterium]
MAMTPTFALAHVFLPNLVKLKGAATVVGVIERREKFFFDQVWSQAHVEHAPFLLSAARTDYRIGVIDLPPPKDLGEAFFFAIVVNARDTSYARVFTLEHVVVLAKKADRTLVCERYATKHTKHFDGPVLTGNKETDATAFIDAFMELILPTRVKR